MRVAFVLYELMLNSFDHQHVAGEDIDAKGMRKAFLKRKNVECCDFLSINLIRDKERRGEKIEYDLVIHFFYPTILIKGAINIFFFHQFYEFEMHNMAEYPKMFDYVMTPALQVCKDTPGIIYFPLAVDPDLYKPMTPSSKFACDVTFVGNRRMRDIDLYRKYISPAMEYNLAIYGNGWNHPDYKEFTPYWKGILDYDDAPLLYSSAKVSLCVHSRMYTEKFHLVTSRIFHALSCNQLIISDYMDEIKRMLPEGKGILFSDGDNHLAGLLKKYINSDEERNEIAQKGREFVLENHTWDHRIAYLAEKVGF